MKKFATILVAVLMSLTAVTASASWQGPTHIDAEASDYLYSFSPFLPPTQQGFGYVSATFTWSNNNLFVNSIQGGIEYNGVVNTNTSASFCLVPMSTTNGLRFASTAVVCHDNGFSNGNVTVFPPSDHTWGSTLSGIAKFKIDRLGTSYDRVIELDITFNP